MPNKKAKHRKQERRKKNEYLKRHGRTKKQIARLTTIMREIELEAEHNG